MKNILFVCYGGGHAAMLVPIIKELQKKGLYSINVLALTTAGSVMEAENIEYVSYKDFTWLADPHFAEIGESLVGSESASSVVPYIESVAYHGVNFLDMVEQYGEEAAKSIYNSEGRQGFNPINFMKRVLIELNVDLLIATTSPRSERAAINAAGELGIQSLCIIDTYATQAVRWIGQHGYGTRLCVLNSEVQNMFIKAGREEKEVVITGNPAFDSLTISGTIAKGLLLRESRGWSDSPVITLLYASQIELEKHPCYDRIGDPALPRKIERSLRELVAKDTRFRLVLRYHPSENVEFQEQENVVFSPRNENLHELLHAVDIVIVTTSTVGLEAHLIGKPVISVDDSIFTEDAPYSRMGISVGSPNVDLLEETIISVSEHLSDEYLNVGTLDATGNVIEVVKEFLGCDQAISRD